MAQDIKPTRFELINLKKKIALAESGHSLLKRKRDGLIQEFFKVMKKAKEKKSVLTEKYIVAKDSIDLTMAAEGVVKVKGIAFGLPQQKEVIVKQKAMYGVRVPEITAEPMALSLNETNYPLTSTSLYLDKSIESYREVIKELLEIAEIETTLKKLLEEIERTKRRVNALEFKVVPEMKRQFKFVKGRLEELEREDTFRLKKIKGKKMKKKSD